jgi:hypothetical protein
VLYNKVQTAQEKIDVQQKRIDVLERDVGACKEGHPYLQKEIDKTNAALTDSRHAFDAFRCETLHQKFDSGTLTCTGVPLP